MAERKGLSAPVPTARPLAAVCDRASPVSADVPEVRGRLGLEGARGWWPFVGTRLLIGRADGGVGADVELADDSVSRRHAEVVVTSEGWQLRDLGSVNGTCVDGVMIGAGEAVLLADGQVVRLGTVELRVSSR